MSFLSRLLLKTMILLIVAGVIAYGFHQFNRRSAIPEQVITEFPMLTQPVLVLDQSGKILDHTVQFVASTADTLSRTFQHLETLRQQAAHLTETNAWLADTQQWLSQAGGFLRQSGEQATKQVSGFLFPAVETDAEKEQQPESNPSH